ncbi:unknown [Acidaminococcus sp. CAG:917]|nr:unknown [Acidaminococcus sp. CAG:917]
MAKDFDEQELYNILLQKGEAAQLDAFMAFYEKYKNVIFLEGNIQDVYDFVYNKCARNERIKIFFDVQSEEAMNGK